MYKCYLWVLLGFLDRRIESMDAAVHGIIGGVPVPFPLEHAKACRHSNLTCPLETAQTYTYSQTVNVQRSYPKLRVYVRWQLWESDAGVKLREQPDVCVVISAQIQDPEAVVEENFNYLLF